jgi:hypothetical protein
MNGTHDVAAADLRAGYDLQYKALGVYQNVLKKLRDDLSDAFDELQGEIRAEEWGNRILAVMRENGWPWRGEKEPKGGGPFSGRSDTAASEQE